MQSWLVVIFGSVGLIYLAVGLVVLFRRLRRRGLATPASYFGVAGDIAPFLVVAALWPLYLRRSREPRARPKSRGD